MNTTQTIYTRLHVELHNGSGVPTGLRQNVDSPTTFTVKGSDVASKAKLPNFNLAKANPPMPVLAYARNVQEGAAFYELHANIVRKNSGNCWIGTATHAALGSILTPAQIQAKYALQRNQLLNKARARFSSDISNIQWDVMVDAAEANKTASMMLNSVKDLANFVGSFKKKNGAFYRAARNELAILRSGGKLSTTAHRRLADKLNSKYLEFTFGWTPLAMSVSDAAALCKKHAVPSLPRSKVSGHDKFQSREVTPLSYPVLSGFGALKGDFVHSYNYDIWVGGLLKVPTNYTLQQELGATMSNIPATLWELTYLSFVADYFINIGDFLNNLRNNVRLVNPVTLYLSEKIEYTGHFDNLSVTPGVNNGLTGVSYAPMGRYQYMDFKRSPISVADTYVRLTTLSPSAKAFVNTTSVMLQIAKTFK